MKQHNALVTFENAGIDDSTYNSILTMFINIRISKPCDDKILHVTSLEFDSLQQIVQLVIDSIEESQLEDTIKSAVGTSFFKALDFMRSINGQHAHRDFNEAQSSAFTL